MGRTMEAESGSGRGIGGVSPLHTRSRVQIKGTRQQNVRQYERSNANRSRSNPVPNRCLSLEKLRRNDHERQVHYVGWKH